MLKNEDILKNDIEIQEEVVKLRDEITLKNNKKTKELDNK